MESPEGQKWSQKASWVRYCILCGIKRVPPPLWTLVAPPRPDSPGFAAIGSSRRGVASLRVAAGGQSCPEPGPAHFLVARRPRVEKPRSRASDSVPRTPDPVPARLPVGLPSPAMSCYIYQLPSWVLDDLCRNMDTLSEWDWMQFGEWVPIATPRGRAAKSARACCGAS